MTVSTQPASEEQEHVLLVQAIVGRRSRDEAEDSLQELERLADTAGAKVVGRITQRRDRPTASFFIGEGKLADIQLACREAGANLVIFDNDLSPVQVNNLDLSLGLPVIDRSELILQIFARRARTAAAKLQVELAQLEYLVSRVPVSEKQHRFTGGIGMRGPGESPFQRRAAPMRRRISDLKKKLAKVQARQRRSRENRHRWPLVALVGYTNAGKSTLLNALARAEAYVDDRLFATLDTKTRAVWLPNGNDAMLTDTVGFIRHLPHGLVASFRSTLEEAVEADLLLVVADAGHPRLADHLEVVEETLEEIGAAGVPSLLVLNKMDRPEAQQAAGHVREDYAGALEVSAVTGQGLDALKARVAAMLPAPKAAEWGTDDG